MGRRFHEQGWGGGSWGEGGKGKLKSAEPVAAVPRQAPAVVAFLGEGVEDAVAAATEPAILAAAGVGKITVAPSVIALLALVHDAVAAEARHPAAIGAAVEGMIRRDEGRIALLAREVLEDAVPAGPSLEFTIARAAVEILPVPVVALLLRAIEDAVPAGGGDRR